MKPEQKAPKPTNQMVDLCLGIALKAHAGQADLDGNPVILHPLTVGLAGETPTTPIRVLRRLSPPAREESFLCG